MAVKTGYNWVINLCQKSLKHSSEKDSHTIYVYIEGSIIEQIYKATEQACQNLEIGFFGVTFVKDSY